MNETTNLARESVTAPLDSPRIEAAAPGAQAVAGSSGWIQTLAEPRFAIPSIAIFGAMLFILNLGIYPLYTKGEPREAVTILDIASGGGVILPMRAGVEIPSKPLLMHWLAALLAVIAGSVNEWTVRIASAIFAIGGVIVCYYYVRRLFDARAALIASLILGTSFQYLQAGTGARVDITLTFFMEFAFFEFLLIAEGLTRRRALLYVAIAMAILTKGPIGLVLPGAVAIAWITIHSRWDLIRDLRLARGAAIVAVLAGWWYVAASIIGGQAFIGKQLIAENFVRFVGGSKFHQGHEHAFYYLEYALMGGFIPWTPILALVLLRAARAPRKMDSRLSYLLLWIVVVLGFYSFSHSKRGVYLLSMYPALATLTALYIVDAIDDPAVGARLIAFLSDAYGAIWAIAGGAALCGLAILWLLPSAMAAVFAAFGISVRDFTNAIRAAASAELTLAVAVPVAILALGIYLIRSTKTAHKMALGVAGGMGLLSIAANGVVVPAIANTLSLKAFTADVIRTVDDHPTGYLLDMDYTVAFYSRRNFPIINFKETNKPEYLLCWDAIWEQKPPGVQAQYQIIKASNPTELDGTGQMLLLKKIAAPPPKPSPAEVNV